MVNIENGVGSFSQFHTAQNAQNIVRPKQSASVERSTAQAADFSRVLKKSQTQQPAQTQAAQNIAQPQATYSPLMQRYGVNRINEVKSIAKEIGADEITNEDFEYAIRYGRSVLADYIV